MQRARSGSTDGHRKMSAGRGVATFASALLLLLATVMASAATLDRLRDTAVLRLGYLTSARPFSYQDESGNPAGYAVALCEVIAAALQRQLAMPALRTEFVAVSPETRFDSVRDGKVDLLCAGGTPTLSLRKKVSFSIPIFPGGIGALLRMDAPARLKAHLEGEPQPVNPRWRSSLGQVMQKRTFVVVEGSRADAWLASAIQELDLTAGIEAVESFDQGLGLVAARDADAIFAEREILLDALRRSPDAGDLTVVGRKFTFEPIAFALQRADEDFRLAVDGSLSQLYRSGGILEVYVPIFGEPDEDSLRFFLQTAVAE